MRSLRRNLQAWVLGALFAGTVLLGLSSYLFTLDEMDEVFDEQLKQVAISAQLQHEANGAARRGPVARPASDVDIVFVTQAWKSDGTRVFSSLPGADIPFMATEGLSTVRTRGGEWRVYTASSADGFIQVAENQEARASLAADVAIKLLLTSLMMAVLIAFLLRYALRRGLAPLAAASTELGLKSAASLEPIAQGALPEELAPLLESINALMRRLSHSISRQRSLISDAAHELRTPLAAVGAQLHLLKAAGNEAERAEALDDVKRGIDRATHLVTQLLDLARLEPDGARLEASKVDLAELACSVVAEYNAKAEAMGIDLGADATCTVPIEGGREELRILLGNLVDNALRYTPRGGRVDVRVFCEGAAALEVRDSGPGIEVAERERVFDRFYRGRAAAPASGQIAGTGLGLAIVKAIVQRHDATLALSDGLARADGGYGLTVRVRFA